MKFDLQNLHCSCRNKQKLVNFLTNVFPESLKVSANFTYSSLTWSQGKIPSHPKTPALHLHTRTIRLNYSHLMSLMYYYIWNLNKQALFCLVPWLKRFVSVLEVKELSWYRCGAHVATCWCFHLKWCGSSIHLGGRTCTTCTNNDTMYLMDWKLHLFFVTNSSTRIIISTAGLGVLNFGGWIPKMLTSKSHMNLSPLHTQT